MRIRLFDIENWREIGATLARNKTRTFLTAFGIFWGTSMLAMLWGGAHGFEGIMRRNFAGISTNLGAVFPGERSISYKGFNKGSSYTMTQQDADAIRRVAPAIEYSSPVINLSVNAAYGTKSKAGRAIGVESDYTELLTPLVTDGRFINSADVSGKRKVAVIGTNIAADMFGNESPVGKYFSLNGVYFLCVGVASQISNASIGSRIDDSFILPISTMRNAFNYGNQIHFFVYSAPQGKIPSENEAAIRRILSSAHSIDPADERAIGFMDISEMFQRINGLFIGISILALFVGLGSLMAGVIGVGNIMWIVVKERTHEFGVRRALGAKQADITAQVLSESILLTLVAGTAGVCFATFVLAVADRLTFKPEFGLAGFQLSFATAVAIVITFFILGSAAGTLPAVKAMRIKPIEAIRDK